MGAVIDIAGWPEAEIPRSLLVISFGRVVWMMEKSGLDLALSLRWVRVVSIPRSLLDPGHLDLLSLFRPLMVIQHPLSRDVLCTS